MFVLQIIVYMFVILISACNPKLNQNDFFDLCEKCSAFHNGEKDETNEKQFRYTYLGLRRLDLLRDSSSDRL